MAQREDWDHKNDRTGRFRGGKTKREKENGTWASRFANRAARVEWQKDPRATADTFPKAGR